MGAPTSLPRVENEGEEALQQGARILWHLLLALDTHRWPGPARPCPCSAMTEHHDGCEGHLPGML